MMARDVMAERSESTTETVDDETVADRTQTPLGYAE